MTFLPERSILFMRLVIFNHKEVRHDTRRILGDLDPLSGHKSWGRLCILFEKVPKRRHPAGVGKDAKKVYTQTTAAVLRMKDCTMQTVNKVQEEAGDILADAKAINESRAAEAAQEVIEDTAEEEQPAEQTAQ